MKLIVGLGNPGKEYEETRHNIGFAVIERLAEKMSVTIKKKKFDAIYGRGQIGKEEMILLKPQTYMNRSGQSVRSYLDYWKLPPEDLLVLHDDLDFDLGALRLVFEAGAAGHRGVSSIIEHLGTKQFYRLRLGIGRPHQKNSVDYVLSRFRPEDADAVETLVEQGAQAVQQWVTAGAEQVQQTFHQRKPS